jgi:molybdopterin-binding protein
MNQLKGIVHKAEADHDISLIEVLVGSKLFSVLTIERDFRTGDPVVMGFKETAMSIGKNISGDLSIRNRFNLTVKSLTTDKVLTKVTLDFQGEELISVVTTASAKRMKINVGDRVEGLVKTTDMLLMKT